MTPKWMMDKAWKICAEKGMNREQAHIVLALIQLTYEIAFKAGALAIRKNKIQ